MSWLPALAGAAVVVAIFAGLLTHDKIATRRHAELMRRVYGPGYDPRRVCDSSCSHPSFPAFGFSRGAGRPPTP